MAVMNRTKKKLSKKKATKKKPVGNAGAMYLRVLDEMESRIQSGARMRHEHLLAFRKESVDIAKHLEKRIDALFDDNAKVQNMLNGTHGKVSLASKQDVHGSADRVKARLSCVEEMTLAILNKLNEKPRYIRPEPAPVTYNVHNSPPEPDPETDDEDHEQLNSYTCSHCSGRVKCSPVPLFCAYCGKRMYWFRDEQRAWRMGPRT